MTVSAVMEDTPENSHMQIDILLSYSTLVKYAGDQAETSWEWYDFYNYIKLKKGSDYRKLEAKFPEFIRKYTPNSEREYVLQPLFDIHLTSHYLQEMEANGNKKFVYALAIIAMFILIIAWVNYTNLSMVMAIDRVKEIGIRKTNGAARKDIMIHFFTESFLLNVLCFGLSIGLYKILLPFFINLSDKNLKLVSINYNLWLILFGIVFIGAMFSGAIPAIVLSSQNTIKAIKGILNKDGKQINIRKLLVGFQYVISIVLIICTISIFRQINFIRNYNLGVNIERTLVVRGPDYVSSYDEYPQQLNNFKTELLKYTDIKSVTAASNVPGNEIIWTNSISRTDIEFKNSIIYIAGIDHDYMSDIFFRQVFQLR